MLKLPFEIPVSHVVAALKQFFAGPKQSAMASHIIAQNMVSQQEEVQRRIVRELHDAVIAEVTFLKRSIGGYQPINRDKVISSLEQIAERLKAICYDLSPSDLRDWGLQTTIEDLLDQVSQRTGAHCHLECEIEIPSLENSVELHIFRIVQESLNKSATYSQASDVTVSVKMVGDWLQFAVIDNGRGFNGCETPSRAKNDRLGMSSLLERVELIRTLYPAHLHLASEPGAGTTLTLSIKLPRS